MGFHGSQTVAKGIHIIQAFEFASVAAMTANGFTSADVGKVAAVTDSNNYYIVTAVDGEGAGTFKGVAGAIAGTSWQDNSRDVYVNAGGTHNIYGWATQNQKLVQVDAFSVVPGTTGTYSFVLYKDPAGTTTALFSGITFDMTSLSTMIPSTVGLTSSTSALTFSPGDVWVAQFTSDNASLDAEGVYFMMAWEAL